MAEAKPKPGAETIETVLADEKGEGFLGRFRPSKDPKPAAPKKAKDPLPAGHPNIEEIGELVELGNMPIVMLAPRDALTDVEKQKLITGLDDYAKTSLNARRFMYGLVRGSALLALANVGLGIALPRLIRHGILPVSVAPHIAKLCDAAQLADACGITLGSANGVEPDAWTRPADIPAR